MPFTAAHPAIVLPFLRLGQRELTATAFVIGSVAPDFEYFLKMKVRSEHSHSIAGLFYFDLPLTIALAFIFHLIVKRNLIQNLPRPLQQRYQPLVAYEFVAGFKKHFALFIICALAGSVTHIFWDSFTHTYGYFAQNLPVIKNQYVTILGARYPMFFVLQHVSTIVGLLAIAGYVWLMKGGRSPVKVPRLQYWLMVFFIMIGITFVRFLIRHDDIGPGNVVVSLISGFCIGLIVMGFKKYQ
jgi:hypothetical protein